MLKSYEERNWEGGSKRISLSNRIDQSVVPGFAGMVDPSPLGHCDKHLPGRTVIEFRQCLLALYQQALLVRLRLWLRR